ncbi:MAG: hypothetical protein FWH55_07480 [Oscillospiraceae bacterium]|nr:hypothetical protein [Oscillospiraceae bacterium]
MQIIILLGQCSTVVSGWRPAADFGQYSAAVTGWGSATARELLTDGFIMFMAFG